MREAILIILAVGLLAAAFVSGDLQRIWDGDSTGIVWGVGALGLFGTLVARWRRWWLVWLCDQGVAPLLGLLGTVLGFSSALMGVNTDDMLTKLDGVETALATTVAGLIVHFWLLLVREFTRT